jgi:hypothetical protein
MDKAQIDKWLQQGRTTRSGKVLTDAEMKAAFDLVKDREHWKNPIDANIEKNDQEAVEVAISWYVYGGAEFETLPSGKVRVTAPGYWAFEG